MPASNRLTGLFALACALAGCTSSMSVVDSGADTGTATDIVVDETPVEDVNDDLGSADVSCSSGETMCDGFCVDLTTDPTHCGSCGLDCTQLPGVAPSITCSAGRCGFNGGCAPGRAHCSTDTVTGCETEVSSAEHCGACNITCSGAMPVCTPLSDPTMFECTGGCTGGQTLCGSTCVNVLNDHANCGSCGHPCGTFEACTNGSCAPACPPMNPVAAAPLSPSRTAVCTPDGVLARGGTVTGLDFASTDIAGTLGGQRITSCITADFGGPFHFGSVVVRARPIAMACTTTCNLLYCNSGDSMLVFAGVTTSAATLLSSVPLRAGSLLADYRVGCNFDARYIIVCRPGQAYTRDDVQVDAIEASCTCP